MMVFAKPNQWRLSLDPKKKNGMEMEMEMNKKRREKAKPRRI